MKTNDILKELRQQKKITQAEAADLLGVSLSSYQKYERDKNSVMPSLEVLIKIADFYGVTTDYLLGREPLNNPLAGLNITVDNKKFIDIYQELPEYQQKLLVDAMLKLGASAQTGKAAIAESKKLGTIEDDNTENETAHQDAG